MKRYFLSAFSAVCLILAGSLSFTGCNQELDLDTNQYKETVALNAYGPLPVLRGGTLRFLGSNLEQIASIELPGASPITSIEVVKSGIPSEIRITVPHDDCQEGAVFLVAKDGTRIEAKTHIKYLEGLNPAHITIPASARPGETIRITVPESGDEYLDMVHMVEFSKGVQVGEKAFTAHTRYVIELAVPENAQTGKLNLYTADITDPAIAETVTNYQIISTETVLEIETPAATKVSSPRGETTTGGFVTIKQGEALHFTGSLFDLVESVKIGSLVITDLARVSASEFTVTVPAEAGDETVYLVCTSGVEVPVATLETVTPSDIAASPSPVKAGKALTLSGKDMDIVVSVEFPGSGKVSGDAITVSEDKVVVNAVPFKATDGAPVKLHMANGKSVETAYQLVVPTVTGYDNASVNAGAPLTILGTDLDLVKTVQFGDGSDEVAVSGTEEKIDIAAVPMNAKSGKPVLKLENGVTIEGTELKINEALFCYITEMPVFDEENTPKAGSTLVVPVANGDKLTGVQINGTDCQYILTTDGQLIVGIPEDASASSELTLVSSNGSVSYDIAVIPATEVTKTLWSGLINLGWSEPNAIYLTAEAFEEVPVGARMTLSYTLNPAQWAQIWFEAGDDVHLVFTDTTDDALAFDRSLVPTNVYGWDANNVRNLESTVVLTQEVLDLIREKNRFNIRGGGAILTKLTVSWTRVLEKDIADFVTNMNGTPITYPYKLTWGDDGRFKLPKDLLLNEIGVKKGSVLRVYKAAGNTGQVQINNNSWSALYYLKDWAGDVELMEQEFDDAMMEAVNNGGLVIQGGLPGITKIAILP